MNKSGRIEKTVEAHRGATICVRWSPDGSQFATGYLTYVAFIYLFKFYILGGEDGQVRIWARSGMLRSNLVQSGIFLLALIGFFLILINLATPIFCVCWSADNDAILYCAGKHLVMKPLSPNSKQHSV